MIEAGAVVACEKCNIDIATILDDIFQGDPLTAYHFEFSDTQGSQNWDRTSCKKCGNPWLIQGKYFYIKNRGWVF